MDMETGKALTKQEGKQYKAYLQRHESRNEEARQADKLFHIVDKYLPLQADETRAFVARFPARVHPLLPKARKIRNRLRREGGPGSAAKEPPSKGDSSRPTTSPGGDLLPLTEEATHSETERAKTVNRRSNRLREGGPASTAKEAPSRGTARDQLQVLMATYHSPQRKQPAVRQSVREQRAGGAVRPLTETPHRTGGRQPDRRRHTPQQLAMGGPGTSFRPWTQ